MASKNSKRTVLTMEERLGVLKSVERANLAVKLQKSWVLEKCKFRE